MEPDCEVYEKAGSLKMRQTGQVKLNMILPLKYQVATNPQVSWYTKVYLHLEGDFVRKRLSLALAYLTHTHMRFEDHRRTNPAPREDEKYSRIYYFVTCIYTEEKKIKDEVPTETEREVQEAEDGNQKHYTL